MAPLRGSKPLTTTAPTTFDETADTAPERSVGAILATSGAAVVLASHFLPWYQLALDASVTVNGWGIASESGRGLDLDRWHWVILVSALVAIVIGCARLLGRSSEGWRLAAIGCLVLSLAGALFSLAAVPEPAVATDGAYLALAGCLAVSAGCALIAFARR